MSTNKEELRERVASIITEFGPPAEFVDLLAPAGGEQQGMRVMLRLRQPHNLSDEDAWAFVRRISARLSSEPDVEDVFLLIAEAPFPDQT